MSDKTFAIVSGGFDPIHRGHIHMIQEAAANYGSVIVLLNSDEWLARKKGKAFMPYEDRAEILKSIEGVYHVLPAHDEDGTVCVDLAMLHDVAPDYQLVFCNGGDRKEFNTPEMETCDRLGIFLEFGVGGSDKAQASSNLLGIVQKPWGRYQVLTEGADYKVKTLTVMPGKSLSMQRHFKRTEFWRVLEGRGHVKLNYTEKLIESSTRQNLLYPDKEVIIKNFTWHQLVNDGHEPLIVLETQVGVCDENDIERRNVS